MKVIYNNLIPFKGYVAINLFGIIFARKEYEPIGNGTLQHEAIHTAQQRELLWIGFYLLYFLEWIWEVITPPKGAYKWISFEEEAKANYWRKDYLKYRKPYAWLKYWGNKKKKEN